MAKAIIIMDINIKTIPHKEHRYPTVGDWYFNDDGNLEIRVSDLGDEDKEFCIIVHELIEAILCMTRGITETDVDKFDKDFEANRAKDNLDEPGDHPHAPYKREHCFATGIERLLVSELGIDWKTYEEIIDSL